VLAVQNGSSNVAKMVLDGVPARGLLRGLHGGFGFGHRFGSRHLPQQPPASSMGENG
jgi:hypothetical protein